MKPVCFDGLDLTPEICARLAASIGETCGKKAGILCDGSKTAEMLSHALISGLMSSGASVWDFGDGFEAQTSFFSRFCSLDAGIWVSGDEGGRLSVCSRLGMPLSAAQEDEIADRFVSRHRAPPCDENEMKNLSRMGSIDLIYQHELMRCAPKGLFDTFAHITCDNREIRNLLRDSVVRLGGSEGHDLCFSLSISGETLAAVDETGRAVTNDEILAICCCDEIRHGGDVAVGYDAPDYFEALAAEFGARVTRFFENSSIQPSAEIDSGRKNWMSDALFLTVRLLSIMSETGASLNMLTDALPRRFTKRAIVPTRYSGEKLLLSIPEWNIEAMSEDGLVLNQSGRRMMLTPSKTGVGVCIAAQAHSAEIAEEMCRDFEHLLLT